jgi:RNA polymerase sigma-70 factor (ECF subfamily)
MLPFMEPAAGEDLKDAPSAALLVRAKAGDRAALEVLCARYLVPLRRWASGRIPQWARDISDTTDVVQDALLQTFKRIELFEPEHDFALQAYLRRAVLNRIADEYRRRRRRPPAEALDPEMPADAPSPADLAMVRERTQRYEAALLRLRQDDRDLIVSRLELGLTYEEIAASSDKPTANAARSAVVRALVRLTEELSRGSS